MGWRLIGIYGAPQMTRHGQIGICFSASSMSNYDRGYALGILMKFLLHKKQ